jgi:hypothetical protein
MRPEKLKKQYLAGMYVRQRIHNAYDLMIVCYFNVSGVAFAPFKDNTPLFVDPYTVNSVLNAPKIVIHFMQWHRAKT